MQFLTSAQCDDWLQGRQRSKPSRSNSSHHQRVLFPSAAHKLCWVARQLAANLLQPRQPCLLWIEEWDIWEENLLHLYYRLRRSYGDHRLLCDAPGHLFLGFEAEDMGTFLQISMLNGWGGSLLTHHDYVNASFSHDGYIDLLSSTEVSLNELRLAIGA